MLFAMLFSPTVARALFLAFPLAPSDWRMLIRASSDRVAGHGVRMHVHGPVRPRPAPGGVVDDERVVCPDESRASPAPRRKRCADRDAEAVADGSTHDEAR